MPTIKEIAKIVGVSRGTVDRVLNNRGGVKLETEEKILSVVKELNYKPNVAGRTLAVKKKQLKLGYILYDPDEVPFFKDVKQAVRSKAYSFSEFGVQVITKYTSASDPQEQINSIDELLQEGIYGLAITPIIDPSIAEKLQSISDDGIPVITVYNDYKECGRIAYVGSDYFQAGAVAAGLSYLFWADKSVIGIISSSSSYPGYIERVKGFYRQCENRYPAMQLITVEENNNDEKQSYAVTLSMLESHPEINVIYLAAAGISGACRAVQDLHLEGKIRVICHDITPPVHEFIQNNVIQAAIVQDPRFQGENPLELLLEYIGLKRFPDKEYYYTRNDIIINENLVSNLIP